MLVIIMQNIQEHTLMQYIYYLAKITKFMNFAKRIK